MNVDETLRKSCYQNFGSGIGSGRVLTSGVRIAKYPTRHSPNTYVYASCCNRHMQSRKMLTVCFNIFFSIYITYIFNSMSFSVLYYSISMTQNQETVFLSRETRFEATISVETMETNVNFVRVDGEWLLFEGNARFLLVRRRLSIWYFQHKQKDIHVQYTSEKN